MNQFNIAGKLYRIYDTTTVKDTFRKREFVVEVQDGNYPQHIKLQVTQDRCALLDRYKVGDEVVVHFNLRGRPFTNKDGQEVFFTNLEAWRIEGRSVGSGSQPTAASTQQQVPDFDDVPF
jgi:single-strand DNA-binding protein